MWEAVGLLSYINIFYCGECGGEWEDCDIFFKINIKRVKAVVTPVFLLTYTKCEIGLWI